MSAPMPERVIVEESGGMLYAWYDEDQCAEPGQYYVPESRLRQIEAERDKWHNLVKSLCDEWNDECPPGCDSYAHEDDCGATSITVAMRKRGEEIAALRAEVAALVELVRDFAYSPVEEEALAVLDRIFKEAK